jgi:hypothetical protein
MDKQVRSLALISPRCLQCARNSAALNGDAALQGCMGPVKIVQVPKFHAYIQLVPTFIK